MPAPHPDQPTAEDALRALEPLVGTWSLAARWPDGREWPGGGTMTFAWDESGAHLVQRSTTELPEAPATWSVIGCDGASGRYVQLYSDDRGVSRIYEMSFGNGEWRLWRDGEPFSQRFVGRFGADGDTVTGQWEAAEDGQTFTVDFEVTYRRTS